MLVAAALVAFLTACSSGAARDPATTTARTVPPPSVDVTAPAGCETALGHHDDLRTWLTAGLNQYIAGIDTLEGRYDIAGIDALEGQYGTVMSRFRATEAQWADVIEDCPLSYRTSATARWYAASEKISELRAVCRAGPGPDLGWNC